MKKFLLATAVSLSLVACADEAPKVTQAPPAPVQQLPAEQGVPQATGEQQVVVVNNSNDGLSAGEAVLLGAAAGAVAGHLTSKSNSNQGTTHNTVVYNDHRPSSYNNGSSYNSNSSYSNGSSTSYVSNTVPRNTTTSTTPITGSKTVVNNVSNTNAKMKSAVSGTNSSSPKLSLDKKPTSVSSTRSSSTTFKSNRR